MNLKTAEQLLPCFRPGLSVDSRVEKAVRIAQGDVILRGFLEAQNQWDAQLANVIHSIEPPEDLRQRLNTFGPVTPEKNRRLRSQWRQTGMLAVALGILVLIGLGVFFEIDRREHFTGREKVEHLLGMTRNMSGVEFEPVRVEAWRLGDWFYMRGFEDFAIPGELAQLPAVGSRVFRDNGDPVALVAIDKGNCLVYVFRAEDFNVELPEDDDWHVWEHDGWAAAIRRQGKTCTMLAFRGHRSEMRDFLRTLRKE
ncbi:hypothetical protein ACXR0O_00800 [Verrucomicrobiota bacterium sgz303538]